METLSCFIDNYIPIDVIKMISPSNKLVSRIEKYNMIYNYQNKTTNEIINYEEFNKLDKMEKYNYNFISKEKEYKFINVDYDVNKITQDTIEKCYVKNYDFYNLNYNEYVIYASINSSIVYFIFDSVNFTFTPVDDLINNKILTRKDSGERFICVKNKVDIDIVDNILNTLISNDIKNQYKKLVYNLIVKQEEKQIIFYDYNDCLLTTFIQDLLHSISGSKFYTSSYDYYENKLEFNKMLKTCKCRCVIIHKHKHISVESQIKNFCKLGFRNLIVCQNDKTKNMYNTKKYRNYLLDNEELLIKCIKEENNHYKMKRDDKWANEISYDDSIFYDTNLLLTNFLKWCCIK